MVWSGYGPKMPRWQSISTRVRSEHAGELSHPLPFARHPASTFTPVLLPHVPRNFITDEMEEGAHAAQQNGKFGLNQVT